MYIYKKQRNEERFDTGILKKEDLDHRSPQFEDLDPKNKKINYGTGLCTFYTVSTSFRFTKSINTAILYNTGNTYRIFFIFQGQPGIHLHDSVPGIHGGVFRGIADPAERKNLFLLSHNQSMTFWWQHEKGLINKTK